MLKTAPKIIEVTVKEVFEALEKNGFEHIRGQWFSLNGGACVLGQAAKNLGVLASYDSASDAAADDIAASDYLDRYYTLFGEYSIEKQLNNLPVDSDSDWFVDEYNAGATIIYWNDSKSGIDFTLPTYADVTKMAREVLEPHFDEVLKLMAYDH